MNHHVPSRHVISGSLTGQSARWPWPWTPEEFTLMGPRRNTRGARGILAAAGAAEARRAAVPSLARGAAARGSAPPSRARSATFACRAAPSRSRTEVRGGRPSSQNSVRPGKYSPTLRNLKAAALARFVDPSASPHPSPPRSRPLPRAAFRRRFRVPAGISGLGSPCPPGDRSKRGTYPPWGLLSQIL